jgi:hypothetical protein
VLSSKEEAEEEKEEEEEGGTCIYVIVCPLRGHGIFS